MVTTLTKRMAEDLTRYLMELGIKVNYLHSDVETLERIAIIRDFRSGVLRRAGRHQPAARRARHSGVLVRCHSRRGQGRFPPLADVADPDHRPRGAQPQRPGHPLRGQDDRLAASSPSTRPTAAARCSREYNEEHGIEPATIIKAIDSDLVKMANLDYFELPAARTKGSPRSGRRRRHRQDHRPPDEGDEGRGEESRLREGRRNSRQGPRAERDADFRLTVQRRRPGGLSLRPRGGGEGRRQ